MSTVSVPVSQFNLSNILPTTHVNEHVLLATDEELANKYQKKTQYQHILDLPDTYIGSIISEPTEQYVLSTVTKTVTENTAVADSTPTNVNSEMIAKTKIDYVPGLFKIFDEIIVNANDSRNRIEAKIATGEKGLSKMSTLKVDIFRYSDSILTDEKWSEKWSIKVFNDGDGIDIAKHPIEQIWIPQMIFGELLTSGNYNKAEEKVTGGKNGYGAKLTNMFSKVFIVTTVDKHRKLKYTQVYRDNMLIKEEPTIEKYAGKPFTEIMFVPDYTRFGMTDLSNDMISLFKKRTFDMAFTSQNNLTVWFNGTQLALNSCLDYIKLYLPEPETISLSYTIPHARWYVAACMSPNFQFNQVSFVNGISTIRGGRHVDYVTKQITSKLAAWIHKKKKVEVRESFIKDNLMVFVNALIVNPSFDSQTKETLTTNMKDFGSKFDLDDKFIESLADSGIVDRALAQNQFQESQILKKTDGKKTRRILDIEKLEDADDAGTKNSAKCTLILTEGDSAKATAVSGISVLPDGRKYYGIFPLRGKLLNTRDKKEIELVNNKEITNIKRILGLQEGEVYTDVSRLRYGAIMILTDADEDGNHIKGLVINYISSHFPSLLKLDGFITSMLTPIVKIWRGQKKDKALSFYTLPEFNTWLEANDGGKGWNTKYYKGLGTSKPEEAKQYFIDNKLVFYHWDDNTNNSIDMAFNKDRADDRKDWIRGYNGQVLDLGQSRVTFTDFINYELIRFSIADNIRSIPNVIDGMKPSHRKILYCAFKRNLTNEIRVAQLAGYVSEHGAYHHGEASLQGAIVNMAQNFPGANNINLLVPEGQFGTRIAGGKDSAQCRYIHTYLTPLTHRIYKKVDEPLLKYTEDDGEFVEPEHYVPIIPMLLVNGADGIGTGWRSEIPQFNPMDLVANIRNRIHNRPTDELVPWYRGFKGQIFKIAKNSWMTRGKYRVVDNKTVEITELPIGTWTQNYDTMLAHMVYGAGAVDDSATAGGKGTQKKSPKRSGLPPKTSQSPTSALTTTKRKKQTTLVEDIDALNLDEEQKILKDYKPASSEIEVKFTLIFEPRILNALLANPDENGVNDFERRFKLTSKLTCNKTMNFFDHDGKLLNLESINQIQDIFYETRIKYYESRRDRMLSDAEKDLDLISVKVRFILEIIEGHIRVNNVPRSQIEDQLRQRNFPAMISGKMVKPEVLATMSLAEQNDASYQYLVSMAIYNLTKDKIEELMSERTRIEQEVEVLKTKTAGDLWLADLDEFCIEYEKFIKDYFKYYSLKEDDYRGTGKPDPKLDLSTFTFNMSLSKLLAN